MKVQKKVCSLLILLAVSLCFVAPSQLFAAEETVQWLNHLEFLPGNADIAAKFNDESGGLELTTADVTRDPVNSFVEQGLQVSPGFLVSGVRVCYELSSADSYLYEISLAQLQDQDPLDVAQVLLDDINRLKDMGPVCVNSAPPFGRPIDPSQGPLDLRLDAYFANSADNIVILGIGLLTVPDPNSPMMKAIRALYQELDEVEDYLKNHTHSYLTGKGKGHNNVIATTGESSLGDLPTPKVVTEGSSKKKKKKKKKK